MTLLTLLKATTGGGGVTASIVGVTRTPSDGTDATGPSLALTIPAGTAIDDYAVAIIELWDSTATNPTLTYPSGFSQIVNYVSTTDGFQKFKVALKKLTAADSGTYSVSGFGSHFRQGHVAILRGIDTTTALDVGVNLAQNASGTALPANSITTVTNGCLLMHVIVNENTCTGLPATGYTEQADSNYTKTNTKIQTTAGTDTPSGGSFSASTLKLGALIAFRPDAGGGGTNYTETPSDSEGLTDSAAFDLADVVTDNEPLTDTAAFTQSKALAENLGLTDAASVSFVLDRTATDTLGLSDAAVLTRGAGVPASDNLGLTDAPSLDRLQATSDTLGLTDSATVARGVAQAAAENLGLTDAISQAVGQVQNESLGLTDSVSVQASGAGTLSPSDTEGLTDSTTLARSQSISDSESLTDVVSVEPARIRTAADNLGLTDQIALVITRDLGDTLTLSDAAALTATFVRVLDETAGLTDTVQVALIGPTTGTVIRPNIGTTSRPGSGITSRPFIGTTVRPG